ncbi:MAG: hypothetical protein QNJ97_15500 [Myxococcota bacterium]|nr:hypothetical protein [Myxococcota bacterium]
MKNTILRALIYCAVVAAALCVGCAEDPESEATQEAACTEEGAYRCTLNLVERCVDGQWLPWKNCEALNTTCVEGECKCAEGTFQCGQGPEIEKCTMGVWSLSDQCPDGSECVEIDNATVTCVEIVVDGGVDSGMY